MTTINTTVPFGPHHLSFHDPRLSLAIPAAGMVILYCPRHHCGCVYTEGTGRWMIQVPVEAVDFLKTLERSRVELPDDALLTWLGSIHTVARELEGRASH